MKVHGLGPEGREREQSNHQLGSNSIYGSFFNPSRETRVYYQAGRNLRKAPRPSLCPGQDQHCSNPFLIFLSLCSKASSNGGFSSLSFFLQVYPVAPPAPSRNINYRKAKLSPAAAELGDFCQYFFKNLIQNNLQFFFFACALQASFVFSCRSPDLHFWGSKYNFPCIAPVGSQVKQLHTLRN